MGAYFSIVLFSIFAFPVPDDKESYRYYIHIYSLCRLQEMFPKFPNI